MIKVETQGRRKLYISVLTTIVLIAFTILIAADFSGGYGRGESDKQQHYFLGKVLTAVLFLIAYFFSLNWIVSPKDVSVMKLLWWFPAMVMICFIVALIGIFIISLIKEFVDVGGFGTPEWNDIEAAMQGALSLFTAIAIVVSITPFLLPIEITSNLSKTIKKNVRTGFQVLDHFLKTQKYHKKGQLSPSVLLVEDDILYATLLMEYFEMRRLPCLHVATATAALDALTRHVSSLKLVVLDNFLRVEDPTKKHTGRDVLNIITERYPQRNYKIVVVSGYTDAIPGARKKADAVFQKPTSIVDFDTCLINWEIFNN